MRIAQVEGDQLKSVGKKKKVVYPVNWHLLSHGGQDTLYGAEINKAYDLLKKLKPKKKVVVAIIDSGFDDQHEDLKDNLWVNKGEIPGDGIDNDGNGYTDDVHGWNFLATKDGKIVYKTMDAGARFFLEHQKRYELLKAKSRSSKEEKEFRKLTETFKKSTLGQAYLGIEMNQRIVDHIDRIDRELRDKFPGEELTREKFYSLVDKNETDTLRNVAFFICGYRWQNEALKWDDIYKYRYSSKQSAERDYEKALKDWADEREQVGDNMDHEEDRFYGNATLINISADHGTHVAGIIGAKRGNGIGIDGIADNVELMLIRAVPRGDEYDKDIASAIRYAVDQGADIINMSFGKYVSEHPDWVMNAMRYAEKKGVLLVHAAGNSFANIDEYPCFPVKQLGRDTLTNFITVGASMPDGNPARASNYGKRNVDVFAPGFDIYSTTPGDNYERKGGTSMAAPVVTGIAAMIMGYYPELSVRQVKDILLRSAVICRGKEVPVPQDPYLAEIPVKALFSELCTGGGIISAAEAVRLAARDDQ